MKPAALRVLLLPLLLVACSGPGRGLPDAETFAAGTCRDAAPAVLALDEQVSQLEQQDVDTAAVRVALQEEQARLRALLSADSDGEVAVALQDVVTRVGFARAALDADALETQEITDVTRAVDRFVAECVPEEAP